MQNHKRNVELAVQIAPKDEESLQDARRMKVNNII